MWFTALLAAAAVVVAASWYVRRERCPGCGRGGPRAVAVFEGTATDDGRGAIKPGVMHLKQCRACGAKLVSVDSGLLRIASDEEWERLARAAGGDDADDGSARPTQGQPAPSRPTTGARE